MYNITAVKGNLKLDLSSFFKDITDAKQVAKDVAIKEANLKRLFNSSFGNTSVGQLFFESLINRLNNVEENSDVYNDSDDSDTVYKKTIKNAKVRTIRRINSKKSSK